MTGIGTGGKLPSIEEQGSRRLPPAAKGYLNVVSAIGAFCLTAALVLSGIFFLPGWDSREIIQAGIGIFAASLLVEIFIANPLRMKYTTYSVDGAFVYITRGRIFRRTVSISSAQILNVESLQGPLLRRFNLVKVKFTCIADVEPLAPVTVAAVTEIREKLLSDPWAPNAG